MKEWEEVRVNLLNSELRAPNQFYRKPLHYLIKQEVMLHHIWPYECKPNYIKQWLNWKWTDANSPQSEQERKGKVLYFEISALTVPTSENLLKEENPTEAFSSVSSQPAEVRKTESDKQEATESVSTRMPTCRAPAFIAPQFRHQQEQQ